MWNRRLKWIGVALLLAVAGAGAIIALQKSVFSPDKAAAAPAPAHESKKPAALIVDAAGNQGVRLTKEVETGLMIRPKKVLKAEKERALPPTVGTLNYDNERLFLVKSRFAGEVKDIAKVPDTAPVLLASRDKERYLRFGDQVDQNQLLAVVWSRDLGEKKAALVDAMAALNLSKRLMVRQKEAFQQGGISEAQYFTTERQVKADTGAVLTAERTLRMWKLTDDEIEDVKREARKIIKLGEENKRDPKEEMKWARVELRAQVFSNDPTKKLTIVEKNSHKDDMVDQTVVMFKLADLSRLQVWVNLPEEFLARMLRGQKDTDVSKLRWKIQIEGNGEPIELPISQVAPSLDPMQHMVTVIGYLDNPNNRYKVGQFVTATIYVAPEPDTVEIPTDALNELEGESLVFVQKDAAKPEYMLRRIAVVNRFKDVTFVRSKLTPQDEETSKKEAALGKRPIQPLQAGERVITRGVVELTAELQKLAAQKRVEKEESN